MTLAVCTLHPSSLSAHLLPLPSSADRVDGFQGGRAGCAHWQLLRRSQLLSSLPCRDLD